MLIFEKFDTELRKETEKKNCFDRRNAFNLTIRQSFLVTHQFDYIEYFNGILSLDQKILSQISHLM